MLSKSKGQTQKIAAKLAKKIILKGAGKHAKVLALIGDLGSGKTTFAQGFIKFFGIKTRVPSPTFVIYRKYPINLKFKIIPTLSRTRDEIGENLKFKHIYHFDLYRIQKSKEIIDLDFFAGGGSASGWKKFIANQENIVLIEWPEKIKRILPKNKILIKFEHGKKANERRIKITR